MSTPGDVQLLATPMDWDTAYHYYDQVALPCDIEDVTSFLDFVDPHDGDTVIDMGCGAGYLSSALLTRKPGVVLTCIGISRPFLRETKR